MEEVNWWEKTYESSLFNELKYMVPEILFLRVVERKQKPLVGSFPFHFGLYLMIATFGLLLLHAFLSCGRSRLCHRRRRKDFLDGLIVLRDGPV